MYMHVLTYAEMVKDAADNEAQLLGSDEIAHTVKCHAHANPPTEMVDDVADDEAQPMALDELLEVLAPRLPQLTSLRMQELDVVASSGLSLLQQLTRVSV